MPNPTLFRFHPGPFARVLSAIPLLLALAALGIVGACKKDDQSDRHAGPPDDPPRTNVGEGNPTGRGLSPEVGPPMNITEPALRTVEELASHPNPSAIIGQSVRFTGVPVQQVLSGQYVIIGESAPGVVVRLKELLPDLKPGQRLDITGMVAQSGEDLAHWPLNPRQKEIVGRHPIFINAIQSGPSQSP